MNKKASKQQVLFQKIFLLFRNFVAIVAVSFIVTVSLGPIRIISSVVLRNIGFQGEDIKIAGTGSMYPTFPKGKGKDDIARAHEIVAWSKMRRFPGGIVIGKRRFFGYTLARGDIVSFENETTRAISQKQYGEEAGFVKRVVALAGDTIEIREGFVVLNGQRLKEAYTARPRSTFGGTTIADCQNIVIAEGKVFVLGDNRVASNDSRNDVGLIDEGDIDHVLAFADQTEYSKAWRDPAHDEELVTQPTLDAKQYVVLLNEKRKEAGYAPLASNDRLTQSAKSRGEVILKFNDVSFDATRSGFTMERAMAKAGYANIKWGEAPVLGYYTAEELIENSFQFPDNKKFLLDRDFDDIGVAAVLGTINGCPTQAIVQEFGGYVPPNYSKDVVDSWKQSLQNLRDTKPSWEKIKSYPQVYDSNKGDVDRLLAIFDERINNIEGIVARMEKNQWLTREQETYVDRDKTLFEEQERLANRLNGK